jgi:hypothetical protein
MNLHEKLFEIQKSVTYLKKNASGYQYRYTSGTDVLTPIREKMDELGVMLFPKVTDVKTERGESVDDKGKSKIQFFTGIRMDMVWVDIANPSDTVSVPWYGQGVDPGEKGVGKLWTYSERYFLLKFFHIPTDMDDPDAFQAKRTEAGKKIKPPAPMDERPGYMADGQQASPNPWSGKLVSISEPIAWKTEGGVERSFWEIETASGVLSKLTTFDNGIAECAQAALVDHSTVQIQWKLKKSRKSGKEFKTAEGMAILDG